MIIVYRKFLENANLINSQDYEYSKTNRETTIVVIKILRRNSIRA